MGAYRDGVYVEHPDIGSVPTREDIERLKARGEALHRRIDTALDRMAKVAPEDPRACRSHGYSSALDRDGAPAPMPDPISEWIEEARSALAAARASADRSRDPRLKGIVAAAMHLEDVQALSSSPKGTEPT